MCDAVVVSVSGPPPSPSPTSNSVMEHIHLRKVCQELTLLVLYLNEASVQNIVILLVVYTVNYDLIYGVAVSSKCNKKVIEPKNSSVDSISLFQDRSWDA